ncbi:YjgP/YjgQ family permease [Treponema phagedenis]|uniref:Permease, YjgP/YjgQ family n=1 Tax=Treponema phagedenis TaxID=162 RepID=A0A0B7GYY7_TREPH|nr:LptF/LptG family permease [Treponema phagedenis]NVP25277.1 YjgP/YjgQ family permease [Treponema phagedenis]QEJ93986.1 YjgP/YjgQ family permease [Treponema phagedenis]QEJ97046.1 YjgP/YjgQ family permease [Treponema phagedenis]QEK02006.1 YjgP/YjgQ family permease [Treponema phagedenis]QEK02956.1 YjgP/YjgQ family permease [Treponema phagedenis]
MSKRSSKIYHKKILFLYLSKELLLYFFVCFLFFFFIFFVNNILLMAEDILSKHAPFKDVMLLMFYSLPMIIANSAPFAALVGTLMCIGRFFSDLEFLAMNALGVSMKFLLVPVLAVGLFISIVSFFTNDVLLPASFIQLRKVYWDISTSTPALELESYSIKKNQNAVVISGLIKDGIIDELLIIDKGENKESRILGGKKSELKKSTDPAVIMTLDMNEPQMLIIDGKDEKKYDSIVGKKIAYNVLAKNINPVYFNALGPSDMTSYDLYKDIQTRKKNNEDKRLLNIYNMEFHKKFSIPFGALFFVFLAFGISSVGKVHNQSVGFILGLLIAVAYWAVLMGGQEISLTFDVSGAFMMWLPNILLLIVGGILLGRRLFR